MYKLLTVTTFLSLLLMAPLSHVWAAGSTPIAQINGEDVALSADTVLPSFTYGSNLKGMLLDSGISFVMLTNRSDGLPNVVTVFSPEDVERICGWSTDLTEEFELVFNGAERYCTDVVILD